MSGKCQEIAAQLADVDWQMSHALRGVNKCERADCVRFLAEFSDRIDCAERV